MTKPHITKITQTLSKKYGVSTTVIESVIEQLFLQSSKNLGPQIAIQSLQKIAIEVNDNPNGMIALSLIQLSKVYEKDNGQTTKLVDVIKKIIKDIDQKKG